MSKSTTQTTFGLAKIKESHKRGVCVCGNSSYLQIARRDDIEYYCLNCARDTWVGEIEQ